MTNYFAIMPSLVDMSIHSPREESPPETLSSDSQKNHRRGGTMQTKEISKSVEDIESQAEKLLEKARTRANEILLKAKEKAKDILSSQLPMDETETKCHEIIQTAKVEADEKGQDSKKKASKIRASASKKIKEVVERMVNIVTGAKMA